MKSLQLSPSVVWYVPDEKNGQSRTPVPSKLQGSAPHLGSIAGSCSRVRVCSTVRGANLVR